jgi:hypothetical protein
MPSKAKDIDFYRRRYLRLVRDTLLILSSEAESVAAGDPPSSALCQHAQSLVLVGRHCKL